MSKRDKANMHGGNNRYREFDEMSNNSNEAQGESANQADCENGEISNRTQEQLEQRENFYNDQVTKVAPIRAMHNDPNRAIKSKELSLLTNKTAVARRLPLRREQEFMEEELYDKEEEQEEKEDDVYSNKSMSAKSPSADVFVEESPSHTHVYRLTTHGDNSDMQHQQQQQQKLQQQQQEQLSKVSTNSVISKPNSIPTLSNEYRGQQELSFYKKSMPGQREGSETGNEKREEDYNAKEKTPYRQQQEEQLQEHTTSHREHNQFYSEVSNWRSDNASSAKKLQNAAIFETNNTGGSNNYENVVLNYNNNNNNNNSSSVNYSQGGSNKAIGQNVNNEEKKSNSCVANDSSWYSRASCYLLPRIDARFARNVQYVQNLNNNGVICNNCNRQKKDGNIVEVIIAHCMLSEVRVVLFAAFTILSLIFTIISLPTSQLDVKNNGCYTYWGYKENCDDNSYYTPMSLLACAATRWRLQVASAFAVISLFTLLIVVGMSEAMIFCNDVLHHSQRKQRMMQITLFVVSVAAAIFQLIAWCFVAAINTERDCDNDSSARRTITYGVGFGFSITSWCLVVCAICIFLITPNSMYCAAEPESAP